MKIVDLTAETVDDSINLCIGSKPGDELAREEKRRWLESRMPLKAGGKLAYERNQLVGMIEFAPIEDSPFPVAGSNLLHINCVWVLPRFQGRGIGEELLQSCVQEAKRRGMKGVSVVANDNPLVMPLSFFYKQGFRSADHKRNEELMWMIIEPSPPPKFLPIGYSRKNNRKGMAVDILYCGQCPWSIKGRGRIEKVAREFGERVQVHSIRTDNREAIEMLGDSKKIFVDGKDVPLHTPTEEDIRRLLSNSLDKAGVAT